MELIPFLCLVAGFSIPITLLIKLNKKLREELSETRDKYFAAKREATHYQAYCIELMRINQKKGSSCTKEIPKGTIQAVKDAMKRSHPDNGGNAEDFAMYRRAYNILTGKEKL